MSQQEKEALLQKILELPNDAQNIIIGAAQMAVMLNGVKEEAAQ